MAVGDVISGLSSVNPNEYLTIQPTGTAEWVIHNIYHAYDVQLEFSDGTNSIAFDTETGAGVYARYAFHVTATRYLRVKNNDATNARLIGYDGVVTHT